MANEKILQSRIQLKHDTEENWLKATNFIPKEGEIVIYDVDANNPIARFKIGDGTTKVNQLSFVSHHKIISYLPQTLLPEEKTQARENIDAASASELSNFIDGLGVMASIDIVSKTDLASDVQESLNKANSAVQKSGDTMTGFLTLNDDPTQTYHAATKQYVDAKPDVVLKTWTSTDVTV